MMLRLCVINCWNLPFSDNTELMICQLKFLDPKYTPCKGMDDLVAHEILFMMAMVPMFIQEEERDAILCKIFASTFKYTM